MIPSSSVGRYDSDPVRSFIRLKSVPIVGASASNNVSTFSSSIKHDRNFDDFNSSSSYVYRQHKYRDYSQSTNHFEQRRLHSSSYFSR